MDTETTRYLGWLAFVAFVLVVVRLAIWLDNGGAE
jgi:hypothetical protein